MSCIIKPWEPLCNQFLNFYFVALTSSNKKTDDIFRNFRKSFQSKCALNFWIWDCYHCLICPWSYHTVPTSRCICAAYEPLKIVLLASGSSLGSYLSGLYPLLVFIYKIQKLWDKLKNSTYTPILFHCALLLSWLPKIVTENPP